MLAGVELGLGRERGVAVDPAVQRRSVQRADGLADEIRKPVDRRLERRRPSGSCGGCSRRMRTRPVPSPSSSRCASPRSSAVSCRAAVPFDAFACRARSGLPVSFNRVAQTITEGRLRSRITMSWTFCTTRSLKRLVGTDVLPTRRLLPDHQTQLVARVEEVRRLGIVRATHHVAIQRVLQQLCIAPLEPLVGRHAEVREQLMAVQTEELEGFAVQVKPVEPERHLAESGPDIERVQLRSALIGERRADRVQLWARRRPQVGFAEPGQRQSDRRARRLS